jgi:hypothetical protein
MGSSESEDDDEESLLQIEARVRGSIFPEWIGPGNAGPTSTDCTFLFGGFDERADVGVDLKRRRTGRAR